MFRFLKRPGQDVKLPPVAPIIEKSEQPEVQALNYDKFYEAVAKAESGNCSTKWHKAAKNCVSIMAWTKGKRHLRQFSSIAESKSYFVKLWKTRYGNKFPTLKEAKKYTGNDKAAIWLSIVKKHYFSN